MILWISHIRSRSALTNLASWRNHPNPGVVTPAQDPSAQATTNTRSLRRLFSHRPLSSSLGLMPWYNERQLPRATKNHRAIEIKDWSFSLIGSSEVSPALFRGSDPEVTQVGTKIDFQFLCHNYIRLRKDSPQVRAEVQTGGWRMAKLIWKITSFFITRRIFAISVSVQQTFILPYISSWRRACRVFTDNAYPALSMSAKQR